MFAPDSAYINQCERDPDYQEMEWSYSLAMSHAVVDSIAAELAAALRELYEGQFTDDVAPIRIFRGNRVRAALQRYDNLTNNKEQ